ncbi:MAG: ATP-binding cassette domain-containing protein [Anaerovoracaceae bacterium]|jgi:peptide/nickel transport system ATP-binding protein
MSRDELLKIENLRLTFNGPHGQVPAVRGVSFAVRHGEILALVGESGCGKTALCRAVLRLHSAHAEISGDSSIMLCGRDVLRLSETEMQSVRGSEAAMIFQDPMFSLDPVFSVGEQIMEPMLIHGATRAEARDRAIELLRRVGIGKAETRFAQYPHQFSGGMRQRVAIATALACRPRLLIADEPTTALDADIRDEITDLLRRLVAVEEERGMGMIFVTHDLVLARRLADRILVMKEGRIVEEGTAEKIFEHPENDYTRDLIRYAEYGTRRSHRHLGEADVRSARTEPLVSIRGLRKSFRLGKRQIDTVLRDFDLDVMKGEILGIIGPSGCGKSTLARCIMGIERPDAGVIDRSKVKNPQMIFQDSAEALNPRMTIGSIIAEPLRLRRRTVSRTEVKKRVREVMEQVHLSPEISGRHPYELSGGQRQRAAIARALITDPDFIIADEPTSSLDVSIQAQIIHLLREIRDQRDLTMILIAHDLPMAMHISDRILSLD